MQKERKENRKTDEKEDEKILIGSAASLFLIGAVCAGIFYYYIFYPQFHPQKTAYIYIDRDDTTDSIYNKVKEKGHPKSFTGFLWMARWKNYTSADIHTGRYAIRRGENAYHVFSRLYRGYQEPVNLTIGNVRTLDRLARSVGKQLMIDSAEIALAMNDSALRQKMGYTKETLPSLFIPDTYQVYWNMSVDEFFARMQKEHEKFWNQERLAKATTLGMTPEEVSTLASIVEEETNNTAEKPMVAGLYINRLHKGMPLQADPHHQVCPSGLRLEAHHQCTSERRFTLQHLPACRIAPRPHTHPLSHRIDAVLTT